MPAGLWNFELEEGADFARTITWRDSAGALVDLTGYTAKLEIRAPDAGATLITTLSTANGRITLGGAAGTIALALTAAVTEALDPTNGHYHDYDLELTSGGGVVTRLLKGKVHISKQVTV